MRRTALAAALAAALLVPAHAADPPEPVYAGKPASWWVERLFAEDREAGVAKDVLRAMGSDAAPWIAARIGTTLESRDRKTLLELLLAGGPPPGSIAPHLRLCLVAADWTEQRAALRVVARLGPSGSSLAADVAPLLAAPQPPLRRDACEVMGTFGDAAAPHVDAIARLLSDAYVSRTAVAALEGLGTRARAALPELLEHAAAQPPQSPVVRALVGVAPDDERVCAEALRAAREGDAAARDAATDAFRRRLAAGDALAGTAGQLAAHPDGGLRTTAAAALGRVAVSRGAAPEPLLALLDDPEALVAGAAVSALVPVAGTDRAILPRATDAWFRSPHPGAFRDLLRALGAAAGPALMDAAVSDRKALRESAWHLLVRTPDGALAADPARIGAMLRDRRVEEPLRMSLLALLLAQHVLDDATRADVLAGVLRDGDPALAARAASPLSRDDSRRGALVAAAARPEPEVREAALHSMSWLAARWEDVRDACVRALDAAEPQVRVAALRALSAAGIAAWAGPSPVREALTSRLAARAAGGPDERATVLAVLSVLPTDAVPVPALVALLAHDDSCESAVGMLERLSADPSPSLRALFEGDDPVLAARAARVLVARGAAPEVLLRLKAWIESDDARVARAAAIAAAGLPPEAITEIGGALVRAARSGRAGVAYPACHALARIAAGEPAARDALFAVADDPANPARAGVAPFLPQLGAAGRERLAVMLAAPDRDTRRNACVVIHGAIRAGGAADWDHAVPALERLCDGDDLELARLAREALTERVRGR